MSYWYVPGMYYPYWWLNHIYATNLDADTDMGSLTVEEFHRIFPRAFPIGEENVGNMNPNQALEYIAWRRDTGDDISYAEWRRMMTNK